MWKLKPSSPLGRYQFVYDCIKFKSTSKSPHLVVVYPRKPDHWTPYKQSIICVRRLHLWHSYQWDAQGWGEYVEAPALEVCALLYQTSSYKTRHCFTVVVSTLFRPKKARINTFAQAYLQNWVITVNRKNIAAQITAGERILRSCKNPFSVFFQTKHQSVWRDSL